MEEKDIDKIKRKMGRLYILFFVVSFSSSAVSAQDIEEYYCSKELFESKYKSICKLDEQKRLYFQKTYSINNLDRNQIMDKARMYLVQHDYHNKYRLEQRATNVDAVNNVLYCEESVIQESTSILKSTFKVDYNVKIEIKDFKIRVTTYSSHFFYDASPMCYFNKYYPFSTKGKDRTVRTAFALFFNHSELIADNLFKYLTNNYVVDSW